VRGPRALKCKVRFLAEERHLWVYEEWRGMTEFETAVARLLGGIENNLTGILSALEKSNRALDGIERILDALAMLDSKEEQNRRG
jgi:hypothetical protein